MDPICLWQFSLCIQTIFEKCPFKENGKLSKLFRLILRGLNLPVRSDTPQNKILRGIKPRRTRSCGVSDLTELSLAGYQTPQNNGRVVHILYQTLVLRGQIPCRTKSCGVSNPAEQHSNTNISANSKQNSKIFQGVNLGTIWGRFVEKTGGQKSRATVPLSMTVWAFYCS